MNTTIKTSAQLYEESAIAMNEKRFSDGVKLVEQAQALEQQEANAAAAAAAAEVQRVKEVERREALRNAPEPVSYIERRMHLTAIAAALNAAVELDVDSTHYSGLKGLVVTRVTGPRRTVVENDERGPEVNWALPALEVFHRGTAQYVQLDFRAEERASASSWRHGGYTGRLRCTVGGFGERQSYPPRKDGSFNYESIADKLMGSLREAERKHQGALKVHSNATSLKTLRAKFKLHDHGHVLDVVRFTGGGGSRQPYMEHASPAGQLYMKLDTLVTPEQAEAILNAAIAAGVKLS